MVMPRPSQSFFMVEIVVLRLRPLTMLLTVDCVTPLRLLSLFMVMFRSWHNSKILAFTASPTFNGHPPLSLEKGYPFPLEKITSFELI